MRKLSPKIPDFTSEAWQASRSDAQIVDMIRRGKGKSMPAMEGKVSPADRERLVTLIRGFRGGRQSIPEEEGDNGDNDAAVTPAPPGTVATHPEPRPSSSVVTRSSTIAIYRTSCLVCHGPDGQGSAAAAGLGGLPNFRNKRWHEQRTPTQLTVSILEGKGNRMPAFRGKLTEPQARELVAHLRTWGGASTTSPNQSRPGEFEKQLDGLFRELDGLRRESRALSRRSTGSSDRATASNDGD
jgi:mono/diheme cytochrome c family protein